MTSSTRVILDPKRQAEVVSPAFDFSAKCQVGDTLSAPTVTVSVWSGVDPAPANVFAGSTVTGGLVVSPKLQAGIVGVIYLVQVRVGASLSGILQLDGLLAIIPGGM